MNESPAQNTGNSAVNLPHHTEAERELLAACVYSIEAFELAKRQIAPIDFYHRASRAIWWAIQECYHNSGVCGELAITEKIAEHVDARFAMNWISELPAYPTTASIQYYIDLILKHSNERKLYAAGELLKTAALNKTPDSAVLEDVAATLSQVTRKSGSRTNPETTLPYNGSRKFRNFRNDNLSGAVDQVDIVPSLPDAPDFPMTPMDPMIRAVQERTQAPYGLCGNSVLAAVNLAVQHLANIEIPGIGEQGGERPINNYFVTIACSTERKSSCDKIVSEGIVLRSKQLEREYSDAQLNYNQQLARFEHDAMLARRNGEYSGEPPTPPREPILTISEPTQEGMIRCLMMGQESQALLNDEGGAFLGGYSMGKEQRRRMGSTLNKLWDASDVGRERSKTYGVLKDVRLTVHLMIQPGASQDLVSDRMLLDLGFLARCLIAEPDSTVSKRPFRRPNPESIEACNRFATHINDLMSRPGRRDPETGRMAPAVLRCSEEAEQMWIDFYNETEFQLATTYATIQGFAGKAPEHAMRLAAVVALFDCPDATTISPRFMQCGIDLVRYYLSQHLRLQTGKATEEEEHASQLMSWLRFKWPHDLISYADIARLGPNCIRKRAIYTEAVNVCLERGHLVAIKGEHKIGENKRKQCFEIVAEVATVN